LETTIFKLSKGVKPIEKFNMPYGLNKESIEKIIGIFAQYDQIETVILYGSRAKGNYKPGSDIDLTLKGKGLNLHILNKISLELDDLLLPYMFDLSIYHHIKQNDLIDHILRVGKVFYKNEGQLNNPFHF
jgi:predicted nucleotidyltransferase